MQTEEQKKKAEFIAGLKTSAESSFSSRNARFARYYDIWNGWNNTSSAPTHDNINTTVTTTTSSIHMKEVFKAIDTILSQFIEMIFMRGNPFKVEGNDGKIDDAQAGVIEKMIKIFINKSQMYREYVALLTELMVTGICFSKLTWKYEAYQRTISEDVEDRDETGTVVGTHKEKTKRLIVKKDCPNLEFISYKDIFYSTRAKNIENTWLIHRTWTTLDKLKEVNKQYKLRQETDKDFYMNLEELETKYDLSRSADLAEADTTSKKAMEGITLGNEKVDLTSTEYVEKVNTNEYGEIEILEYWNDISTQVTMVAGGCVLIYDDQNPYDHMEKPFQCANLIVRPGEIEGIGIVELCEDANELLNTSVNIQIDNDAICNNIMMIADRSTNINADELIARKGGVIWVNNEEGKQLTQLVQQLVFSKVNTSALVGLAINEIQEVSSASKIMQGTYESGAVRSNGQTRTIATLGQSKIRGKVLTFEEMWLMPYIRQFYGLLQQYMTEAQVLKYNGQDGTTEYIKVSPEDIALDIDFIPVGSRALVQQEQLAHQLTNFLTVAAGVPNAVNLINFKYLIEKIWQQMSGEHDTHELFLTEEQMANNMAQQAIQQQLINDPTGQGQTQDLAESSQPNMAGGVQ